MPRGLYRHSALLVFLGLFFSTELLFGQDDDPKAQVYGKISLAEGGKPEFVRIYVKGDEKGAVFSQEGGSFALEVPAERDILLVFDALSIEEKIQKLKLKAGERRKLEVIVKAKVSELDSVDITGKRYEEKRFQAGMVKFDPKRAKYIATPSGDFTAILKTLGAGGNNEMTSGYNVRGGNFDENLIYVNDMLVYRPFLVRSGNQEGLSFVNPDMVQDVSFSTGGWQPRYGDKLSSVLDVKYKAPDEWTGDLTLGVLNSSFALGGASKNKRMRFILGARHRSTRYLFQSSDAFKGNETQGDYFPTFQDVQGLVEYDLTPEAERENSPNRTTLSLLMAYARNRYQVFPRSRETTFGAINQALRIFIAFEGEEQMNYDTRQMGAKLDHRWNRQWKSSLTISGVNSLEREKQNVEGGYRLCDVNTNFGSESFNECIFDRGVGTFFRYGRNDLDINVGNFLNRNYFIPESEKWAGHSFEFGFGGAYENIKDNLYEYEYIDSADYVDITELLISKNRTESVRFKHYAQHTIETVDTAKIKQSFTYGYRINYWSLNGQWLFSPRLQYGIKPKWQRDVVFKAALGVYQQPGFYRELRRLDGTLNRNLKAQRSYHAIASVDYNLNIWDRPFKLTGELYGKYIENAVAYVVDNVRIRYYANNNTEAMAYGTDLRLSGEFIRGTESWFYLGVMSTREDLGFDQTGWVARPTDQRITFGTYFEDHLPNNPTVRVHMNLVFGTGLPFGPPNNINNRTAVRMPSYRRLDIGFAKILGTSNKSNWIGKYYESAWIGLEVMNVLGVNNTVSYVWIDDIDNNQWAVPNYLTARFLNLKAMVKF